MGAWGHNNFENDTALDWIGEFRENPKTNTIKNAFNFVKEKGIFKKEYYIPEDYYLDADEATNAIVAAEVICLAKNRPSKEMVDQEIDIEKIKSNIVKFQDIAKYAISKIIESSELKELWEESEDFGKWIAVQKELLNRLN